MTSRTLGLTCLSILTAACVAVSGAQVNAPRVPKGLGNPSQSASPLDISDNPETTESATPQPFIPRTPFPTWPAPFTYRARTPPPIDIPGPVIPILLPPDTVNILLIGSDRRIESSSFRTDVLIVLSIHPRAGGVALISIPRDLYVYIPGFSMERINAAYIRGENAGYPGGGSQLLGDTILYNLGIQIHHYASVEMTGFREVIDILGGVDVHVACPYTDWRLKKPTLDPENEKNWALFTVPRGIVHMDGEYALWYARARKRSSDFDRSRRQQEVLRAAYRKAPRLNLLTRLPDLYEELTQSVTTDIGLSDLLELVPLGSKVTHYQIRSRFIGRDVVQSWKTPSGGRVLLPKPKEIRALLEQSFAFEEPDLLLPKTFTTVEVINASSHPEWGTLAVERLEYSGFAAHVGPRANPGATPTHLIDYGQSEAAVLESILRNLGLTRSSLVVQPEAPSPFSFRLVLGDDYRPCFDQSGDLPN